MGCCPYGACDGCRMFASPPSECHFWSPLKKTCIMSSQYEEDEAEDVFWLYRMRKAKMAEAQKQTCGSFLEDIERLKALKDGWLDGEGLKISEAAAELAKRKVLSCFSRRPPHVFPTPEGGLSLEWDMDEELDAEIGPDLKGMMIWKDAVKQADWSEEKAWTELAACWLQAVAAEEENGE